MTLLPPYSELSTWSENVQSTGYAVLRPQALYELSGHGVSEWNAAADFWNNLPPDKYLKDGGRYRQRRHASFILQEDHVVTVPHRAHWQPVSYNALHGGIDRWFEPCETGFMNSSVLHDFLGSLGHRLDQIHSDKKTPWYVEVHQFRIDTTDGIGRPTPEGAHRDGVDYVAVLMLNRHLIKGGETRVFESDGVQGQRFTLNDPHSLLILDDARVIHETTPIQPLNPDSGKAWRDTLVVTFRKDGFQDSPKN